MRFTNLSNNYWSKYTRLVIWVIQLSIFAYSGILAFLLRFELDLNDRVLIQIAWSVPIWLAVKTVVFHVFTLDRGGWRYVSISDVARLCLGNVVGSCIALPFIVYLAPAGFPRSVFMLDLIICTCATAAVRLATRICRDSVFRRASHGKRTIIYGAGQAGVKLISEIRNNPHLGYNVRGFVDDNRRKTGLLIQATPVLGVGPDLLAIASKHAIEEVLIAIPSAHGRGMTAILRHCHNAGLRCRTIPGLAEIIETRALTPQIRDIAVEDLLGRTPVHLNETAIRDKLENRVVIVTGAAGSIGSELCRQIARFRPSAIIGYDVAESPLFEMDREMRGAFSAVTFYPEIGNIQNRSRFAEVLKRHAPSVLYHAAAYKHVPLMESHLFEAVENNILGTDNVAIAAAENGVADFVLISSDKAVRPTNIMGATKRSAELLIKSLQNGHTKYVSVRFGNVLGSNGSVIPIFKKQIASGGPVTVTHPEMRRYFMTIPEAAQLVLQASTMGKGGEVFVLDMGQPVNIVDLAYNLILLSGLRPNEDIRVEFTGVRPGEKLYEELSMLEENTVATFHEKIKVFAGGGISLEQMQMHLATIRHCCAVRDPRGLLLELKLLAPEYNPSADLLRLILTQGQHSEPAVSLLNPGLSVSV